MGANDLSSAERAEIPKKAAALEAVLPNRTVELQRAGYRAIAQFQLWDEQFSDCLKTLEKPALGITEPDASALFLKAVCLNRLGRLKKAQAALAARNAVVRARQITPESERFLPLSDLYGLLVLQREAQAELAVR